MEHKKSMYLLSTTAMLESLSFYVFAGLLVLYMVDVLHFSEAFASYFFGIAFALPYLFQLIGGFICDRFLGNRKSVLIGIVFILIAQLIFTYDASLYTLTTNVATHSHLLFTHIEIIFLIAVGIMAIGVSFFKVSLASFFSLFYTDEKDLDSAFSVFYMFINIGAFIAPLTTNFIVGVHHPGLYQYGFLVGFIAILIGLIMFLTLKNKILILSNGEAVGIIPRYTQEINKKNNLDTNKKLSKIEINRLKVIFLVLILETIYIIGNQQIFSSLIIFAESNVNNVIPFINYTVAPQIYLTLNPIFIIIVSPIQIKLFNMLSNRNKEVSSFTKIGVALLVLGISYLVLSIPVINFYSSMKINMIWIVLFSFCLVNSELLIMPVALSLVSKLAPKKYTSLLVGTYYLVFSVGEFVAGEFAAALPNKQATMLFGFIPIPNMISYFFVFVIVGFVIGTIWLIFRNKIRNLAQVSK